MQVHPWVAICMELQEFKVAARSIARALCTLHSNNGAHHDVRAANVCWQHNSSRSEAVVVDVSTCGSLDTCPAIQLRDWTPTRLGTVRQHDNPTLNSSGAYTQFSDMHQMGFMLTKLSKGLPWERNSKEMCEVLHSKQLTASQTLAHPYIHHG